MDDRGKCNQIGQYALLSVWSPEERQAPAHQVENVAPASPPHTSMEKEKIFNTNFWASTK